MTRCYLDSNILINLKFEPAAQHQKALHIIELLTPDKYQICISSLTIDEFIHSLTFLLKHDGYARETIQKLLEKSLISILKLNHLAFINPPTDKNRHLQVLKFMYDLNLSPRDAYHLLIMQENGIKNFATFDRDFKKVFGKKLLMKIK